MNFILIMTLLSCSTYGCKPNVSTAEFSSEQACRYAGAQQEVVLRNDFRINTSKYYTFICVPKGQ